jgi:hypothetical protein
MVLSAMLDRIKAVQWQIYIQPEWNKPSSVADALAKILRTEIGAYDALLYAVGNNHAGTYYPVLLAVMPFLEEIIQSSEASPQRTVLSILDDLFASFHPEPGYEEAEIPELGRQKIEVIFKQRIRALVPALELIVGSGGSNSSLARELLCLVSEDAAQ